MRTRDGQVMFAKTRALEILNSGDVDGAFSSLISDLTDNPETDQHAAIPLGMTLMMGGHLSTVKAMRAFIVGCN